MEAVLTRGSKKWQALASYLHVAAVHGALGQLLHLAALTNITELLSPPYMPCTVPASPPLSSSAFSSDARRSKIHLKHCHRYYMHACNFSLLFILG